MNKQGKNGIEWCDYTWNPVTGCLHNCPYCYAAKMYKRFGLSFEPIFHPERLTEPAMYKIPHKIFVVSAGDLFGEWVPDEWIQEVFKACEEAPQHKYLFLTKNPKRYLDLQYEIPLPTSDRYWYGTTVNNSADFIMPCRAEYLSRLMGCKKFLSIEPIFDEIHGIALENLKCFHWIIIGAETGNRKGKVAPKKEWIERIVYRCRERGIPVFMKDSLKDLMGDDFIQEWPEGLT